MCVCLLCIFDKCIFVYFTCVCFLQVSVYSVPDKKEHTHFALDTASSLLLFYNSFFDINYPLKKLGERTHTHRSPPLTHRQITPPHTHTQTTP